MAQELEDRFGRRFAYLRLSLTEICNFRCGYCLPHGYQGESRGFLRLDEIRRLLQGFAELGIRKVRITGGEPLVRRDILAICRAAKAVSGIETLALTTNGYRLAALAEDLRAAGLDAVNVSLDSLDADTFQRITGDTRHNKVLTGIDAALNAGIAAVKINTVLLKDENEHEVPDFIDYVRERPVAVRFIELMQTLRNGEYFRSRHVPIAVIAERLMASGWRPKVRQAAAGPAIEYVHPDYRGRIGLIAPYAPGFCDGCNRLRVTARGGLRLCLFGHGVYDLRPFLQTDAALSALKSAVLNALFNKPRSHSLHWGDFGDTPHLALTGG